MKTEFQTWFEEKQVERTIKALQKNNFDARFVPTATAACDAIFEMIPEGATVGVGGSMTLGQIGFFDAAKTKPIKLLNPASPGLSPDEALELRRHILLADVFISSSNAVTEDGKLYNIDATGNRVAAMIFGPKKVILVCGVNKIVRNVNDAQSRVQNWAAPMNSRRLKFNTPCATSGECADCASPQRICNVHTVMVKKPTRTEFTVLLVGESLGL
jgi:hypothetical protein